jgi:hypothetical protein
VPSIRRLSLPGLEVVPEPRPLDQDQLPRRRPVDDAGRSTRPWPGPGSDGAGARRRGTGAACGHGAGLSVIVEVTVRTLVAEMARVGTAAPRAARSLVEPSTRLWGRSRPFSRPPRRTPDPLQADPADAPPPHDRGDGRRARHRGLRPGGARWPWWRWPSATGRPITRSCSPWPGPACGSARPSPSSGATWTGRPGDPRPSLTPEDARERAEEQPGPKRGSIGRCRVGAVERSCPPRACASARRVGATGACRGPRGPGCAGARRDWRTRRAGAASPSGR